MERDGYLAHRGPSRPLHKVSKATWYAMSRNLKGRKCHCTVIQGVTTFDFTLKKDHLGESIETNDMKEWMRFKSTKTAQNCMFLEISIDIL